MGIFQVAHGGEGDVDHAVYVAHFPPASWRLKNANDFEAETVHPDVLTQRIAPGEQFLLGLRADHRHPGVLYLVYGVVEASLCQFQDANGRHVGIVAGDTEVEIPGVVLDVGLLADFGSDVGNLGKVGGQRLHIIQSKVDEGSRLLTTRLQGSTPRSHDDQLGAEVSKDIGAGPAKTIAVSQQHHHGGDAPGHAQHGEGGAAAIVPHGAVGFSEQITEHRSLGNCVIG